MSASGMFWQLDCAALPHFAASGHLTYGPASQLSLLYANLTYLPLLSVAAPVNVVLVIFGDVSNLCALASFNILLVPITSLPHLSSPFKVWTGLCHGSSIQSPDSHREVHVGFLVDKVAMGLFFSPSTSVLPCRYYSTNVAYSFVHLTTDAVYY